MMRRSIDTGPATEELPVIANNVTEGTQGSLVAESDGQLLIQPVDHNPLVIGSGPNCTIRISSPYISRRHCALHRCRGEFVIQDLDSTNGTRLTAKAIHRTRLPYGSIIHVAGIHTFLFLEARNIDGRTVHKFGGIWTANAKMINRIYELAKLASLSIPVLITGESGTGKELFARALHDHSRRRRQPFVAVNCGALADTLNATELFGHERGAFTGADATKPGALERADRGTLLLDEIGELQAAHQARMLRVLETGMLTRIGGCTEQRIDVRLVCATNRNLEMEMGRSRFRADLYYRIGGYVLDVPPLRERPEDIPVLARLFLESSGGSRLRLSQDAINALMDYHWPGNVRQLRHCVQRLTTTGRTLVRARDLGLPTSYRCCITSSRQFEEEQILRALVRENGHRNNAAKLLGMKKTTFYARLKAMRAKGIEVPERQKKSGAG